MPGSQAPMTDALASAAASTRRPFKSVEAFRAGP